MYNQRDVLIVRIPFTDLKSSKKRPVLVLSNDRYNAKSKDLIVAAITSNISSKVFSVIISSDDMETGSLKTTSCIRADKIYTISQDIVIIKIGAVKDHIFQKVIRKIEQLLKAK
ncbi:MAG: type II toxin-antitoxin system PemK/MazF family toxin [Firmicutes bacterium]|nr:type II toxin-antitoxin system PemK/MazF family toxin [Bacillota bacterium]